MAATNLSVKGQAITKAEVHPRFMIELSPELLDLLNKLAAKSNTTPIEILKKAIALLDVSTQAKDDGHKIGILDQDDKLIQEIVGI
jgi:predicted transcriptional regulator